jgi:TetR/AcrR family transcriptional regulator, lmrAB and yxaGH operons repressor
MMQTMQSNTPAPLPLNTDTRERLLVAAQRLFRKRGYHATGLSDILEAAQAPKGSLYHHFPGGKEAIGVCVVEKISNSLLGLLTQSRARSTEAVIRQAGAQMQIAMEKTNYELCTLFASFTAERKTSPQLGLAVTKAYGELTAAIEALLLRDGLTARAAKDKALLVTALMEGGLLLSQAQSDSLAFKLALKQAVAICTVSRHD